MKKHWICSVAVVAVIVNSIGCSTHRAFLAPEEFKGEMNVQNGSQPGEKIGPVKGEDGGAIWNNCTEKAKGSMHDLIAAAKGMGANAIGDLKWYATGTSQPGCKKGWGYLVIWPFILTPLFMSTEVEGIAYKTKGGKATGLLHMLPNTAMEEEALVNLLVAQTSN